MTTQPSSGSVANPSYWWYVARGHLFHAVLGRYIRDHDLVLDVGSADGPSVEWMSGRRIALDLDLAALDRGGVCGSATRLPFSDTSFDVVCAFDVIEHFEDDVEVTTELLRVLKPGGRLLTSVPAYNWAWSPFDVEAGHHRRYSRSSFRQLLSACGADVRRSTYAFAATLPFFIADRLRSRFSSQAGERVSSSRLPRWVSGMLLRLATIDRWLLRFVDLPFGSSIITVAEKTDRSAQVT